MLAGKNKSFSHFFFTILHASFEKIFHVQNIIIISFFFAFPVYNPQLCMFRFQKEREKKISLQLLSYNFNNLVASMKEMKEKKNVLKSSK